MSEIRASQHRFRFLFLRFFPFSHRGMEENYRDQCGDIEVYCKLGRQGSTGKLDIVVTVAVLLSEPSVKCD